MKFFLTLFCLLNSILFMIESNPIYSDIVRKTSPMEGDLFEGDIAGVERDEKGAYVIPYKNSEPWPNGEVPYFIDPAAKYSKTELSVIESGLKYIEEVTKLDDKQVIKFVKLSGANNLGSYPAAIRVIRGSGCYSSVGMRRDLKIQNVSIGNGCVYKGTVAHEFIHALGFYHEQSRPDRDDWVTVHYENVKEGSEHNFIKYPNVSQNGIAIGLMEFPYDYGSIMHYGAYYFSKNGLPTIVPRKKGVTIGLDEISYQDALEINAAYKSKSIDELLALLQQATTTKKPMPVNSGICLTSLSIFQIISILIFLSFFLKSLL